MLHWALMIWVCSETGCLQSKSVPVETGRACVALRRDFLAVEGEPDRAGYWGEARCDTANSRAAY